MPSHSRFQIGPWLADPAANELVRGDEVVRIEPKMMELLVALAARPGETITRDDLLDQIWPEVVVTEDALSGTVSKLRRVLGDDARQPDYIETIPRTGYRLVAPVTTLGPASPTAAASRWAFSPGRGLLLLIALSLVVGLALVWMRPRTPEKSATPSIRPVTRAAGVERYPALDASGQRLAFAARARDSTFYHLFVQSLDAESPRQLTAEHADDVHPAWSPDGQAVAFLRCLDFRCHVYTVPALGGTPRRRAEASVSPHGLAWQKDDLIVVDRDSVAAPYHLLRLDLATGTRTPLTSPPRGALGDIMPTLSPDGTIAFVRHGTGGNEDLYLLPPGAAEPVRLTHEQGRILGLGWGADASELLISARREGTVGVWRIGADGVLDPESVAPGLRDTGMLAAHSGHLVIESRMVEINLWEAVPGEGNVYRTHPLLVSASADREPALSPDGTRIAFVSNRSGAPELWTARRDGSAPLRLTDFGGTGLGAPTWLPGERIAFEVQHRDQANIYVVDADGGTPQPITDAVGYDVAPRASRDGQWLYFGSDRSGAWQVWKVPLTGGAPIQVTQDGGFVAMESPDGQDLYFTRYFESGLWAMPTEGGPTRRVLDALSYVDWGNWASTDAGIVWLERTTAEPRLALHARSGPDRTLLTFGTRWIPSREASLSMSQSGMLVVYAQADRIESDLIVVSNDP